MSSTRAWSSSATTTAPESLAGVMGGEASGCDESTTDVLIETALWDPMNIAHTGRKLGIVTDARYRFERGVDPAFALPGIELATQLVLEFCGGEPSELTLAGELPRLAARDRFSLERNQAADRARRRRAKTRRRFSSASASASRTPAPTSPRSPRRAGARTSRARPISSRKSCASIGVDNVPSTPLPRADGVAPAVLTMMQKRARNATPRARRPGPRRGGDLVLRLEGAGGGVWRRQAVAGARQSDRRRTFRHAAEPVAGAGRGRWPQRRARSWRSEPVRSRPDLLRRRPRPASASRRRACGADWRAPGVTGRRRRARPAPSTPRPTSWRC